MRAAGDRRRWYRGHRGRDPAPLAPTTEVFAGVVIRPVGVYAVKDGEVSWQPAIDVMRVILGGQLLGLAAIFATRALLKRH